MTTKNTQKNAPGQVTSDDFPALQEFLRGYFHEDMMDDYGSVRGAVEQFCEDADAEQRRSVSNQWEAFRRRMKDQPLEAFNQALTEVLGSTYRFSSIDQAKKVTAIFVKNTQDD